MNLNQKFFVAGSHGMVGSAICRSLNKKGFKRILTKTRVELDLTNQKETYKFLDDEKPDYVVIAAAKVGGISANHNYPADFIYNNLMIELNLIHGSFLAGINNILFLGSSCIYPKKSSIPIKESALLRGALEPTNEPYAVAKIAGIKLCESYNRQYGTDYRSIMPTNLYGPNDNFHPKNSHVVPALIRKFHEAKINFKPKVEIWGSGNQKRDFLHVDDMADASIQIMRIDKKLLVKNISPMLSQINVGSGIELSIKQISHIIKELVGYDGEIVFNKKFPDGTIRKLLDNSKMKDFGWRPKISFNDGIQETYKWYLENIDKVKS